MLPRVWFPKRLLAGVALPVAVLSAAGAADVPSPAMQSPSQAAAAPQTKPVAEVELPTFQPGMWEYQRSAISAGKDSPRQATIKKCTAPSEEMRKKRAELTQKGCRFSPMVQSGNTYSASWTCPAHGSLVVITQVIAVTSDSSYQDSNEARFEDRVTRTRIVATRVGECPLLPGAPKRPRPSPPLAPSSGR